MNGTIKTRRTTARACDRCYQIKERCDRSSLTSACRRCNRLKQDCLTVRPVRPGGRRRIISEHMGRPIQSNHVIDDKDFNTQIKLWPSESLDLSSEERDLLEILLKDHRNMRFFVADHRSWRTERDTIANTLQSAWSITKDVYLAYAGILKSLHSHRQPEINDEDTIYRINSAMLTLRNLQISGIDDVKLCLSLGHALALSTYSVVGTGVFDICHFCLSVAKPHLGELSDNSEAESRIGLLMLLEIMECIVHRRKPSLRMEPRSSMRTDRYLGLCLPLLPFYHDLCVLNFTVTDDQNFPRKRLEIELEDVRIQVLKWQPFIPDGFIPMFSKVEIVRLLAQAKVYRYAALLFMHRMQHHFGQEDGQADIWSGEVMMELDLAHRLSDEPLRFVTLPFIIAAIEIRSSDGRMEALRNVNVYVDQFSPVVQNATKSFLVRIWHERDHLEICSWFDSLHKPCAILDSLQYCR